MQVEHEIGRAEGTPRLPEVQWQNTVGSFAVIVAGIEVIGDVATGIETNVSILYSVPLVLAALARNRRLLWLLTIVLVCSTIGIYLLQAVQGQGAAASPLLINRLFVAICLVFTALVLTATIAALDELLLSARATEQKNEILEATNRELKLNDLELRRQNGELQRLRTEAEDASNRKTQMLAALSHDIRSPIQAISLLSELVGRTAERPELAAKIPELAQRLQSNALSVVDFLSEVIDVASFDAGRVVVNSSEFSLEGLLNEQCQRLAALADAKGLCLRTETAPEHTWLMTDRVKLGRVIGNLIGNAVKFTRHGSITVSSARGSTGTVLIRVADTGCGIAEDELSAVFGEYAQLRQNGSQENKASGWGLGLAISRRMSRLLGGDIYVQSKVAVGSTFTVWLPSSCVIEHKRPSIT